MAEYLPPKSEEDLEHSFAQLKPYMTPTLARNESARCLFCYDAPCVKACPTEIDIPLFIRQIHSGNITGAAKTICDSNYFGNICGKVCPTEVLCEGACVYNHENARPIEIGRLQSFATAAVINEAVWLYQPAPDNGKKIAIIGAGPGGIACACELRLRGYTVDIFEAKKYPSGLALYGCAPYKVTNEDVMEEIAWLQSQFNFAVHYEHPISSKKELKQLEEEYDAIFLGIGLGATRSLSIPGAELPGCARATEFIEQVKIEPLKVDPGKRVIVIGGGNTAMDAASESARLGAEEVILAYRRPKESMRAYEFEYELAKGVGVQGLFQVVPVAVLGDDRVRGVRFQRTTVKNGKVEALPGSEFEISCDRVIWATGQEKQTQWLREIEGIELDEKSCIKVDPDTFQTTNPKYFSGGDAVNGGKEVVNAVAEGKRAARGINRYLFERAH